MMKCVIIDDEPLSIQVLRKHVEATHGLSLMKTFNNPFEGLYYIQTQAVDLVFLDIQMPGVNGLQFIRILKYPPKIIITSAYREFALEALELGVVDYLLKPIGYERFLKAVGKAIEQQHISTIPVPNDADNRSFYVKKGGSFIKISESDIHFLQGDRNYCFVQLSDQRLTLTGNLSHYLAKLSKNKFFRVHKSYVVALDRIEKFNAQSLWVCGTEIPIGRTYKLPLMSYLEQKKL